MGQFIPYFHFENPEKKMMTGWCLDAVNWSYHQYPNVNLLDGKNTDEIEQYFTGNIDMTPFMRMFTSIKKAMAKSNDKNYITSKIDKTALSWAPLALIPQKMNTAISTVHRVPFEILCEAQDALAMKKKKEDIDFLKNKELIEEDLQDIADQLQIRKVDLGTTKNGATKYSGSPMGLDLSDPDEENIFSQLLYSLSVEKANEKALEQIYALKKADMVRLLEETDQFKLGVSSHWAFKSSITGLNDIEYIYPGDIDGPPSGLPDFSDQTHRIISKRITVLELFNKFGDEIKDKKTLETIINGDAGYCKMNEREPVDQGVWDTFRVNIKYFEVKTVDWIGVASKKIGKREAKYFTTDKEKAQSKIWGQNTICFWWLVNTKYIFGIDKLGFAYRCRGDESYQNFSSNVYRSQKKSATEVSIGHNKKAQIADIKAEFALIKSGPAGKYINLKFLRSALSGLKQENGSWTQEDLLDLAFESNTIIGDTEGFEGKNDGQLEPFREIPGGIKSELGGYWETILRSDQLIANITGINEPLTGTKAEELVGLQESRINSALNSIWYVTNAMQHQYQHLFNIWAYDLQSSIEAGGKIREGVVRLIGIKDTEILDGLNQTPLHNLTIKISLAQRDYERAKYLKKMDELTQKGVITTADEYILDGIKNLKERIAYLAVKEKRFMKEAEKIRAEQFAQSQQLLQQESEQEIMHTQAEGAEKIKQTYAKGDVEAKLLQLANQLGLSKEQQTLLGKLALQRDRSRDQKDKLLSGIREKKTQETQAAL